VVTDYVSRPILLVFISLAEVVITPPPPVILWPVISQSVNWFFKSPVSQSHFFTWLTPTTTTQTMNVQTDNAIDRRASRRHGWGGGEGWVGEGVQDAEPRRRRRRAGWKRISVLSTR